MPEAETGALGQIDLIGESVWPSPQVSAYSAVWPDNTPISMVEETRAVPHHDLLQNIGSQNIGEPNSRPQ